MFLFARITRFKHISLYVTFTNIQFGEIIECRVLKDRNSKSNKGVAFVQFSLRVQANNGELLPQKY
jgi:ABC-type xylose transport system substrate-binding protein